MEQRPEFFLWPDYLFYLQKLPDPPRNQLVVPKINQELNEPSYEMVGVKITAGFEISGRPLAICE